VLLHSSALFGQVVIQISPIGVHGIDEVELFPAGTGLDLLLSCQGVANPVEFLIPDELVHIVMRSEGVLVLFGAMAVNAVFEGAGGAGVEDGVVLIRRYICITFFGHGVEISAVLG